MHRKVAIVGFGDLGKQFLAHLKESNQPPAEVLFFDDNLFTLKSEAARRYSDYTKEEFGDYEFYIGLGYKHMSEKKEVVKKLALLNRNLPSFLHSTSFCAPSAQMGQSNFIYPMCNIDKEVSIGNGVLINNSVIVSHNTSIGDCCYISPGVVISGNVHVGEQTFIGSGSILSNSIKIGKNVRIGIGTVVTTDIPDNTSVIGNPAKILSRPLNII